MPAGETEERPSAWTVDTLAIHLTTQLRDLRVHLDERYDTQTKAVDAAFAAQEKAVYAALAAAEKAVAAALTAAQTAVDKQERQEEHWRMSQNEWRGAMDDRESKFLPRSEATALYESHGKRIETVEQQIAASRSERRGLDQAWGYVIAIVGAAIAVAALVIR